MFKHPLLARKYASALHQATEGKADLSKLDLSSSKLSALKFPALSYAALIKIVGEPSSPEVKNLLKLLARRKRHRLLPEIVKMYERISDEAQGIQHATVVSTVALERQSQDTIFEAVKKISSAKSVKLHLKEDTSLVGGIVIRIGDTLIDGSVKSKLEAFRQKFA